MQPLRESYISKGIEVHIHFHSDHLGSASWISNSSGAPVQHLQYRPFGEPFVDQKAVGSDYDERFTFTGKERDEETGYYNFGARYLDPLGLAGWLSVDPLSDKYPSVSPYMYCLGNPMILVDPNGEDVELTFYGKNTAKEFTKTINNGLQGQFEAYYTEGKNGGYLLNLKATEGGGDQSKMSAEGKEFYRELYNMTMDHSTTAQIDVKNGVLDVAIGNYTKNAIDIADINQFDAMGKGAATKQGKLTHELVEQFGKAKAGYKKGEYNGDNYKNSHQMGINAENRVNGTIRGKETYNRGSYSTTYTDKKGNATTYSYNTRDKIIKPNKTR